MKLNEKYCIEKESNGFSLVEKTEIEVTKDGKKTGETKDGSKKRYYGTVYQALQGFLSASVDDSYEEENSINHSITATLKSIDNAKDRIKAEFCIEVKKA